MNYTGSGFNPDIMAPGFLVKVNDDNSTSSSSIVENFSKNTMIFVAVAILLNISSLVRITYYYVSLTTNEIMVLTKFKRLAISIPIFHRSD